MANYGLGFLDLLRALFDPVGGQKQIGGLA
jgi:hypothetical protein